MTWNRADYYHMLEYTINGFCELGSFTTGHKHTQNTMTAASSQIRAGKYDAKV